MPAAVAKGIILSISLIAALGLAVVENPQIQQWLEEQRRKIAEILRQIGEELDPQSRQTAEAFAFEGRTTSTDEALQREESGSRDAAEVATGRSLSSASTVRRIPIRGPSDPNELEERRRKGREYLARRNQQKHELQQRRKAAAAAEGAEAPPSPTFDELVDADGKLKSSTALYQELPSVHAMNPLPMPIQAEMREVERQLSQPILVGEAHSSASSGWQLGSSFANPFGDEYALERSITPKPPVPPKIELDRAPTPPISIPGSFESIQPQPVQEPVSHEELSYDEQLAIALSLSEQDSASVAATDMQRESEEHDNDLKAAIAASLIDIAREQAVRAAANSESVTARSITMEIPPLVDLTPTEEQPSIRPSHHDWVTLFSPSHEPLILAPQSIAPSEVSDELYRLTPQLTQARLASWEAQQMLSPTYRDLPFDPVRETSRSPQTVPHAMDSSFHSAIGMTSPRPSTNAMDCDTPQLIDVADDVLPEGARTPTSQAHSSFGFQSDSDTETFASLSAPASRPRSRPRSEVSNIEVVELTEDSDVDMLSEEGDGIATPDSWSEVGSRDADSEMEDEHVQQQSRATA